MKKAAVWALLFYCWVWPHPCMAHWVASSQRSIRAIARVKPGLSAELGQKGLRWGAPVFIRIFKQDMTLEVWLKQDDRYRHFKTYPVCTYGGRGIGPKTRYGDGRAPEGFYTVAPQQMNPRSHYHLAFNLGYPNAYDRARKRTGSALMVHGRCVSIGCFAMQDRSIEEIYALADAALRSGQPCFQVHIFPFRMTDANLRRHQTSPWSGFWRNMKEGAELFDSDNIPPKVMTRHGRYEFESRK